MQLQQRRKANRDAEAVSGVAEGAVPKGKTPWERVISVCNFNSEGLSKDPFKELSRCVCSLCAGCVCKSRPHTDRGAIGGRDLL